MPPSEQHKTLMVKLHAVDAVIEEHDFSDKDLIQLCVRLLNRVDAGSNVANAYLHMADIALTQARNELKNHEI